MPYLKMRGLSVTTQAFKESPTRKIDALREKLRREGRDIIVLSTGQPSIPPPPEIRSLLAKELVESRGMELFGYTPSQGIMELREAVSEDLKRLGDVDVSPDNIVIVNGGQEGMFATIMSIINPGDEVILLDPTYFGYKPIFDYFGANIKRLRLNIDNNFKINVDELNELVTEKTKALVLVDPDNPTGNVVDKDTAKAIAELAIEKDFWIISDEAYRTLIYEGEHAYIYKYAPEHVISINTFSKDPGMPGWRLGFVYGPKDVIDRIKLAAEEMTYCPPIVAQRLITLYLRSEVRIKHMNYIVNEYRGKRDVAIEAVNKFLPKAKFVKPRGSMFMFLDLSNYGIKNAEKFAQYLLENYNVAVIPGSYFSDVYTGAIRISFVAEGKDRLIEGIKRIGEALNNYKD